MGERTLTVNGLSKTFSMTDGGSGTWPARPTWSSHSCESTRTWWPRPALRPVGAAEAIGGPGDCVTHMVAEYRLRRDLVWEALSKVPGIRLARPHGAFYAFPGWERPDLHAEEVAQRLLRETHVALVPGTVFGPGGEGHVRLSYCCANADVKEGVARMAAFFERL